MRPPTSLLFFAVESTTVKSLFMQYCSKHIKEPPLTDVTLNPYENSMYLGDVYQTQPPSAKFTLPWSQAAWMKEVRPGLAGIAICVCPVLSSKPNQVWSSTNKITARDMHENISDMGPTALKRGHNGRGDHSFILSQNSLGLASMPEFK
ncbi:hypothetical protein BaRGS_00019617 [Batillaria attramentaria]|uniref:Uncharacterized protein n=1 Tax=Batillaria attramentaria TaxID=370345 RepID=A0ABD0KQ87_9CAEN